jgi:hypothetical protein
MINGEDKRGLAIGILVKQSIISNRASISFISKKYPDASCISVIEKRATEQSLPIHAAPWDSK